MGLYNYTIPYLVSVLQMQPVCFKFRFPTRQVAMIRRSHRSRPGFDSRCGNRIPLFAALFTGQSNLSETDTFGTGLNCPS